MDDELKQRLIDYMDTLESAAREGGDFMLEQAPFVVQEFVIYSRISETLPVAIGTIMLALCAFATRRMHCHVARTVTRKNRDVEYDHPVAVFATIGWLLVNGFAGLIFVFDHWEPFLMSWFAPRILILEKVAELIK